LTNSIRGLLSDFDGSIIGVVLGLIKGLSSYSPFILGTLHIAISSIENVDPLPYSLVTLTLPPICSTINLQIDSPSPLPEGLDLRCSSKLLKLINSPSNLSGGIPQPKSCIASSNLI
jgi:hypothetical protein